MVTAALLQHIPPSALSAYRIVVKFHHAVPIQYYTHTQLLVVDSAGCNWIVYIFSMYVTCIYMLPLSILH